MKSTSGQEFLIQLLSPLQHPADQCSGGNACCECQSEGINGATLQAPPGVVKKFRSCVRAIPDRAPSGVSTVFQRVGDCRNRASGLMRLIVHLLAHVS